MRIRNTLIAVLTTLLLGGALLATAIAKPGTTAPPPPAGDALQVTMTASKGRLGVAVLQISRALRAHLGAPDDRGVLVDAVTPDSPAARAGLRVGDVLVEVDGAPAASASDVLDAMADRKRGDAVVLAIRRAGVRIELSATLEDDPGPAWRSRGSFGATGFGKLDPQLRAFMERMPSFDGRGGSRALRRSLEDAQQRLEELERRLEQLEQR